MPNRHIEKYLDTYSEHETHLLSGIIDSINIPVCEYAVIIPCYDENPDFFIRLVQLSHTLKKKILLVLIINRPEKSSSCEKNKKLLHYVKTHSKALFHTQFIEAHTTDNLVTVTVDRSEEGPLIPVKEGVGLARKIASDIAILWYLKEKLRQPWIYSTDADTHLPENYFEQTLSTRYSAYTLNYTHINNQSDVAYATKKYEQAMNYYVAGLKWSNSPYAFHTIGSSLVINLHDYCKVRGFPKRSGAEDFYLLNKLRKLSPIERNESTTLKIESRLSHRVPFGTGPAVQKILRQTRNKENFTYYHPNCFINLKSWIGQQNTLFSQLSKSSNLSDLLNAIHLEPQIIETLHALSFEKFYTHAIKHAKTSKDFQKHLFFWFDAFKTLKFIRLQQEKFYPAISLEEALDIAPFKIRSL